MEHDLIVPGWERPQPCLLHLDHNCRPIERKVDDIENRNKGQMYVKSINNIGQNKQILNRK